MYEFDENDGNNSTTPSSEAEEEEEDEEDEFADAEVEMLLAQAGNDYTLLCDCEGGGRILHTF
jgi:hypothetical protein